MLGALGAGQPLPGGVKLGLEDKAPNRNEQIRSRKGPRGGWRGRERKEKKSEKKSRFYLWHFKILSQSTFTVCIYNV